MTTTLAITLALLSSISSVLHCEATAQTQEPPTLTFADLKHGDIGKEPFKIDGFVIEIYKCPPCPPGAMCKPCIGDHIVVTDNLKEEHSELTRRLRIFTEKPDQFELKKSYTFTVTVRGNIREGHAIEDSNLIGFDDQTQKKGPTIP